MKKADQSVDGKASRRAPDRPRKPGQIPPGPASSWLLSSCRRCFI